METRTDPYSVLGVDRDAALEDIQSAYRKCVLKWHPDVNPGNEEEAAKHFKQIEFAFELLSDPVRRREYDRQTAPAATLRKLWDENKPHADPKVDYTYLGRRRLYRLRLRVEDFVEDFLEDAFDHVCLLFPWLFKFGLLSLLALTVAFLIRDSWRTATAARLKEATATMKEQRRAVEMIEKLGGRVVSGASTPGSLPPEPAWRRELAEIAYYADIRKVDLCGTQITDAGLQHLERLTRLQTLDLDGTPVTDAGLEHLKGLTQLRELWLGCPQVTDAGLKRLKQALPNCEIYRQSPSPPAVGQAKVSSSP